MIARPKISRNERKTTEIGAFEVGNFAPFSCPGLAKLPRAVASMLFVVTAYAEKSSFVDMKSAFVGLFDPVEGEMCRYAFDCRGDHPCANRPPVWDVPTKL